MRWNVQSWLLPVTSRLDAVVGVDLVQNIVKLHDLILQTWTVRVLSNTSLNNYP